MLDHNVCTPGAGVSAIRDDIYGVDDSIPPLDDWEDGSDRSVPGSSANDRGLRSGIRLTRSDLCVASDSV